MSLKNFQDMEALGDFIFLIGIFSAIFCFSHAAELWLKRRKRRQAVSVLITTADWREYNFAPVPVNNPAVVRRARVIKFHPRAGTFTRPRGAVH